MVVPSNAPSNVASFCDHVNGLPRALLVFFKGRSSATDHHECNDAHDTQSQLEMHWAEALALRDRVRLEAIAAKKAVSAAAIAAITALTKAQEAQLRAVDAAAFAVEEKKRLDEEHRQYRETLRKVVIF